jgi:hypothetical protein
MPKGTTTASNILALIFNATTWTSMAQNASVSPYTNLYLSLHNATPGAGGTQSTNETAYTNYARIAVIRTSSGWTIASNVASNTALAQFAQCGVTGDTLTYVGIGTASSGAGNLLYFGALSSSLTVSNGIQPQFAIASLQVTET